MNFHFQRRLLFIVQPYKKRCFVFWSNFLIFSEKFGNVFFIPCKVWLCYKFMMFHCKPKNQINWNFVWFFAKFADFIFLVWSFNFLYIIYNWDQTIHLAQHKYNWKHQCADNWSKSTTFFKKFNQIDNLTRKAHLFFAKSCTRESYF